MVTVHHRHATIDGHAVAYREAGGENPHQVLLLHGAPASSFMFRDLIPLLAKSYHVIAPDYLGFGLSDAPSAADFDYTFEHLTDSVAGLLAEVGFDDFTVYTQDYGAPVAWRLALRNPDQIAGIITQNGNAYTEGFVSDFWKPLWQYAENPTAANAGPLRASLTEDAITWQYFNGVSDASLVNPDAWMHDLAAVSRPGNDEIQLALYRDYPSNVSIYPAVQKYFRTHRPPTLVIWGEGDQIFAPAGAQAFLRDLPDAELHLRPGGHFLLESDLEHTSAVIIEFLGRVWDDGEPSRCAGIEDGLTLRSATATDLPMIVRGERHYMQTKEPAQLGAWTAAIDRNLDLWIGNLARTNIMESDGKAVGYSVWTIAGAAAVLITVGVLPQYRRQGIGRKLLDVFIHDGKRAGATELKVGALLSNNSRSLYESAGFTTVKEEDGYAFYAMPGADRIMPTEEPLAVSALPDVVTEYLNRSQGDTPGTAKALLTSTATISDNGTLYYDDRGITNFLEHASTEFDYTSTLVGAKERGNLFTAVNRLDGNFPGGTALLNYTFTLTDDHRAIDELRIEF